MTTEFIPDSPILGRPYCPACEPIADPSREILDVRYCSGHEPLGDRDAPRISGSAEAGGSTNRDMCALLHRARKED